MTSLWLVGSVVVLIVVALVLRWLSADRPSDQVSEEWLKTWVRDRRE